MTTENLLSTLITNRDAVPSVKNNDYVDGANVLEKTATITTTTGKTTGSTYRFFELPSNCRLSSLVFQTAAQGTSTALDIGVYRNTADGSAVVSSGQPFFASALDVSSALGSTDVTNESGNYTLAKQQQQLWQAVGLTTDPGGTLDIVATSTATINTGAIMSLKARYVI